MTLNDVFARLQATPISEAVAESAWIFPTVESLHVAAITLVVGSILVVDLRLVGLSSATRPSSEVEARFLKITWAAFAAAALTGATLFLAKPIAYAQNPFFLGKLALLLLAAGNMAAFHVIVQPRLGLRAGRAAARVCGFLSLVIWVGVVALGRWTGFTL